MVYLKGQLTKRDKITPEKHKFIGMFRPPSPPISDGKWAAFQCSCGILLWTVDECRAHRSFGHIDIPQYIDICK